MVTSCSPLWGGALTFFFFFSLFPCILSHVCSKLRLRMDTLLHKLKSPPPYLKFDVVLRGLQLHTLLSFTLRFFFPFQTLLFLTHSPFPILVIRCLDLPPSSVSWLAPILLGVLSLPFFFSFSPNSALPDKTISPISTPDVSIFLPAFHARLNATERPTPLSCTGSFFFTV